MGGMSIKIIRKGTPKEEIPIETSCNKCGTVFSFLSTDALLRFDQRDGDFYEIGCPVCRKPVYKGV